jgi:hypothetical protein
MKVTIEFKLEGSEGCGLFTFVQEEVDKVREAIAADKANNSGNKKAGGYMSKQRLQEDFDWNMFIPARSNDVLKELITLGVGTVLCTECNENYTNDQLILDNWKAQSFFGSRYVCPNHHAVFVLFRGIAELRI